jgi:hypothetical protein
MVADVNRFTKIDKYREERQKLEEEHHLDGKTKYNYF